MKVAGKKIMVRRVIEVMMLLSCRDMLLNACERVSPAIQILFFPQRQFGDILPDQSHP